MKKKDFIKIYNKHPDLEVSLNTARVRYKLHWNVDKALYEPLMKKRFIEYWEKHNHRAWKWLKFDLFRHRVCHWRTFERALTTNYKWHWWARRSVRTTEYKEAKKKYKVEVSYGTYRINRLKWLTMQQAILSKQSTNKDIYNLYNKHKDKIQISLTLFRYRVMIWKWDINEALYLPPYWRNN